MVRQTICLALACAALSFGLSAPSTPQQSSGAIEQQSSVKFALGGNAAEVPATFVGNLIFLPVRVNDGAPSLFELDSTAVTSAIDPGRASELQLEGGGADAGNETSRSAALHGVTLDLPSVAISLAFLPVVTRNDIAAAVGQEYQGTVGNDAISRVVLVVNYQRETLQIYEPGSYHAQPDSVALPLGLAGTVPTIHARFSMPRGKSIEGDFALDTALDASVIFSNAFAERHRVFAAHVKTVTTINPEASTSLSVALARLKTFEIGKDVMENLIGEFPQRGWNPPGDPRLAGIIGGGILRRFTVVLDVPHRQAYFEPNAHFNDYDQEDKSGLALVASGPALKTFEVIGVQAGSPAATAGIQKGDIIAGVDGEPAADMTLNAVRELLRDVGYKRKLSMERNEKPYDVTLDLGRLL